MFQRFINNEWQETISRVEFVNRANAFYAERGRTLNGEATAEDLTHNPGLFYVQMSPDCMEWYQAAAPLFEMGEVIATRGATTLWADGLDLTVYLKRHVMGDWAGMESEDVQENRFSIGKHLRLFAYYQTERSRIWIITEADRSRTTILLPEEY